MQPRTWLAFWAASRRQKDESKGTIYADLELLCDDFYCPYSVHVACPKLLYTALVNSK